MDLSESWRFHDALIRRWFTPDYQRVFQPSLAARLPPSIPRPIPQWLEHWLAFGAAADDFGRWFSHRDIVDIEPVDTTYDPAFSMLMQGECDVFWSVKVSDWDKENPPVFEYSPWPIDESGPEWATMYDCGVVAPFLAAFALAYQFKYLNCSSLNVVDTPRPATPTRYEQEYGTPVSFGHLLIYENGDSLAVLDNSDHYRWSLKAACLKR